MIESAAHFSPDGKYRYYLARVWDTAKPQFLYIGLNPSTADATENDPTIRRLIQFTKDLEGGGFFIVNLFAYRTPSPAIMKSETSYPVSEPNNPEANNQIIKMLWQICQNTVFCWGTNGSYLNRDREVIKMFPEALCFGKTKEGHPKHPLYLSKTTRLSPWKAT